MYGKINTSDSLSPTISTFLPEGGAQWKLYKLEFMWFSRALPNCPPPTLEVMIQS